MSKTQSAKIPKTLLVSSAVAFSLLIALGAAQAQQDQVTPPTAGTSRQIEVISTPPADAPQPGTEQQIGAPGAQQDGPGAQQDGPGDPQADLRADAPDGTPAGAPPDANVATGSPQDAPANAPVGALQQPIESAPPTTATTTATAPIADEPPPVITEEKRRNRQRYIDRYDSRQYTEPRNKHHYEPRYRERYVEPRYVEPRYAEPRYVEPRYVAPKPGYVEPRYYAPSREYYGSRGGY
jgi:hypothetical protein